MLTRDCFLFFFPPVFKQISAAQTEAVSLLIVASQRISTSLVWYYSLAEASPHKSRPSLFSAEPHVRCCPPTAHRTRWPPRRCTALLARWAPLLGERGHRVSDGGRSFWGPSSTNCSPANSPSHCHRSRLSRRV